MPIVLGVPIAICFPACIYAPWICEYLVSPLPFQSLSIMGSFWGYLHSVLF